MIDPTLVKPASWLKPDECKVEDEVVEKRKPNSKTYSLENGQFKVASVLGQIHYKNDPDNGKEQWKDIDLTIIEEDGKKVAHKAPYDLEIWEGKVGYSYTSKNGGRIDVELVEIGGQPIDNERFNIRRDGNVIWWDNVADGVDVKIILRPLSAELFKRLSNKDSPRSFKWKVSEDVDAKCSFRKATGGVDDDKHALEITKTITGEETIKSLETGNDFKRFYYEEGWTGRVGEKVSKTTRQKEWTTNVKYPVVIDATVNELIVANSDDGQENTAGDAWDSITGTFSTWGLLHRTGADFHGGVRFQTLGVPQGATINSANLKFNVSWIGASPEAKIYADDVDDAASWSNGNLPSGITKTTASQAWSPTTAGTNTVNITNIVQEIISRTGWASGNDIRFAVLNNVNTTVTGSYYVYVYDYNGGQADAAKLEVVYSVAGAGPAGVKTLNEVAIASVKTINEVAIANVKAINDAS